MKDIIERFDLNLKNKGNGSWEGACPFHELDNTKNHTPFKIDEAKGFYCFHCHESGGPISFVKKFYGLESYGKTHQYIYQHFNIKTDRFIEWENKIKEPYYNYLKQRGLSEKVIEKFKLSPCTSGSYHHRIEIPVFSNNELVGRAYRTIDDREPKYLVEKGFKRSQYLYNLDSLTKKDKHILLFEGFFSVFKMFEDFRKNALSSMGYNVSDKQTELLIQKGLPLYVCFNGDESGNRGAEKLKEKVAGKLETIVIELPKNLQPDELQKKDMKKLLKSYGL